MAETCAIEIFRVGQEKWRVVERTRHATQNVYPVGFGGEELAALLEEIAACFGGIETAGDSGAAGLRRLGGRLAEICLPPALREKVAAHAGGVDFFLDDDSVRLPVELFPNRDGVLAGNVPVARHWFCESAGSNRIRAAGKRKHALIVANPAKNLPAAQKEGTVVHRIFDRRKDWQDRFLGRSVSVAELSRELPDTDFLHLAAHYEMGAPDERTGVVMADGRWLPSGASSVPEVVFANCCRAGFPSNDGGDLSLAGHFLKHGSRHVIAPFLPVPDKAALDFATAFYKAWDQSGDVAEAVWSARRAVGPAGWMYWYFGPTLEKPARAAAPAAAPQKKRGCFWPALAIMTLSFAAALPWLRPVEKADPQQNAPLAPRGGPPINAIADPLPDAPTAAVTEEPIPPASASEPPETDSAIPESDAATGETASEPAETAPSKMPVAAAESEATSKIEAPESAAHAPPPASTPPADTPLPAASPGKSGLFAEALADIERRQSFEEAFIQALDGYPETYLRATMAGRPGYDAAAGKATVAVEVTIDAGQYRSLAARLGETLRRFGYAGEAVSATMKRPYDSFMEIRFQYAGKRRFRDALLLCTRMNDALTGSEWEFYQIPRNSIDAILSGMNLPVLSVALMDHSGLPVASRNKEIPKPFVATGNRAFMLMPVFENGEADMTITSLVPGESRLLVKMDFDLSPAELKKIAGAVCVVEKGNRLPDAFRYRFLRKE